MLESRDSFVAVIGDDEAGAWRSFNQGHRSGTQLSIKREDLAATCENLYRQWRKRSSPKHALRHLSEDRTLERSLAKHYLEDSLASFRAYKSCEKALDQLKKDNSHHAG